MERKKQIDQMITAEKLSEEDVKQYVEDSDYLMRTGHDSRIKNIPEDVQSKIANLFKNLRREGIYSAGVKNGKLQWQQIVPHQRPEADERFFRAEQYSGECTRHKCRGCEHFQNCKTRGYEWLRGINTILSRKRDPGEGKKMAEDFVKYMDDEFMKGDGLPF